MSRDRPAVEHLAELVNSVPLAGLLLVVALGYGLSRLTVRGVSLGPAGATLFVALALGHAGVRVSGEPGVAAGGVTLGALGFALFIYSVGFDAAPHFFSSFRERRGWGFVAVGVSVNVLALLAALTLGRLLALDASSIAGLLAGALTSAATYAAASEIAPDPTRLSVAFALTYPFGLLAVVLLVQLAPWLGGDLRREAELAHVPLPGRPPLPSEGGPELTRSFEVREEGVLGRPLHELDLTHATGCVISRVRRGTNVLVPGGDTELAAGDVVTAVGRLDELRSFEERVGPETLNPALEGSGLVARRVEVLRPQMSGASLRDLGFIGRFHCVVTRIERGRHWIEPDASVVLTRGDVVELVGRSDDVRAAAAALGRFEPSLQETDLAAYAGGLVLGLLLGAVRIPLFGVKVGLGTAGALLGMGLLLGWRQRLGPLRTHVPLEARQLVRDLGILLFVGETGLHAGAGLLETLRHAGWETFGAGAAVNGVAVVGALLVARHALRLRPVDAWGSVAGGLTSSAALQTVRRAADGNEAALSYAAAYAIGSVLATLAGPLAVAWAG